jgi:YfiH family protein
MTFFEWDVPGPYRVVFSSRVGGVSEGPYESLNLGILTEDDPERVVENRRRLCAAAGVVPEQATMAWQVHGADVVRADGRGIVRPGMVNVRCDGLWTDDPELPVVLLTADCLPVALARLDGPPAVAALHVGWRGLLAGIIEEAATVLGEGPLAAAVGPGIGVCCFEVGDEVAQPFRERFGDDILAGRHLDLQEAAARALAAVGCETVEQVGLCTSCEEALFFSHRRDQGVTGRQGIIAAVR